MKRKTLVRIVGSVAILLLVVSLATPFLVKSQLRNWLLANGAEQAGIERLYLNLWSGRLELEGLEATAADRPTLSIGRLHVDVSYRELWQKRFQINQLIFADASIPVRQQEQQWLLGPVSLPVPAPESQDAESQPDSGWGWGLNELKLASLAIDTHLEKQGFQLEIASGQLRLLRNWLPDENSFFQLHGSLNNSEFELDSQGTPLAENATGELAVKISGLALAPLLSPWLPELKGTLSSDLKFAVQQHNDGLRLTQTGSLKLRESEFQQSELTVNAGSIDWDGSNNVVLTATGLQSIDSDGTLAVQNPTFQQQQLDLKGSEINWQGSNKISFGEQGPEAVASQGKLQLAGLSLKQPQLQLAVASVGWDGGNQLSLAQSQVSKLASRGQLIIDQLDLQQTGVTLQEQQLRWNGSLDTDLTRTLTLQGDFGSQPSVMKLDQLSLATAERNWQGNAELDLKNSLLKTLRGNFGLDNIEVSDHQGTRLISVGGLSAGQLQALEDNRVQLRELKLSNLQLLNKQKLLSLSSLTIDQLQAGQKRADAGTVRVGAVNTALNLNKAGQPQAWLDWLAGLSGPQQPAGEAAKPRQTESPYHFAVSRIELDQPAVVGFSDQSVNANDIEISIDQLELTGIDSQSSKPGPFRLAAKINQFAELNFSGKYSWMAASPSGDWKGKLVNLELPPFSPFMRRYSGYQLQSGQFSLISGGSVSKGQVSSNNKVNINNLRVEQAPEDSTEEFDQQLGMPLGTAISILTDDDNNVELDIPVEGSVDDPQFGYQSVINIVMAKVAKEGAISYLTAALQPYGALITLGRMVADSASKNAIDLDPVSFTPGSSELDDNARGYLTKISELLKKREGIRLNLCGIAVAADGLAIQANHRQQQLQTASAAIASLSAASQAASSMHQAVIPMSDQELKTTMKQLAEERSAGVKKQLLEQEKIDAGRLFSCLPEVRANSDLPPQVSLGL